MRNKQRPDTEKGFSLIELIIAMTIMLAVLAAAFSLFGRSLSTRQRESSRTDALTAAQAALNVISREIANSGYGLVGNGIVSGDSNLQQLHIFSNVVNTNSVLTDPGENITYFYEPSTQSILRYDANQDGPGVGVTSIIINRVSSIEFEYFNYAGANPVPVQVNPPTGSKLTTGRIRVKVTVTMERIVGQVNPYDVVLTSDVTLRNSDYMLQQY
jgi:prepilin-type N-terminal cleavage/methylation domain-containing protein